MFQKTSFSTHPPLISTCTGTVLFPIATTRVTRFSLLLVADKARRKPQFNTESGPLFPFPLPDFLILNHTIYYWLFIWQARKVLKWEKIRHDNFWMHTSAMTVQHLSFLGWPSSAMTSECFHTVLENSGGIKQPRNIHSKPYRQSATGSVISGAPKYPCFFGGK